MVDLGDALLAESVALKADRVHSIGVGLASGDGFGKWQNIFCDSRAAADEGMSADAHKMMHRAKCADRGILLDNHVAAKRCSVGQNYVIANHAIVRDVRIGYYQYVAAHAGQ